MEFEFEFVFDLENPLPNDQNIFAMESGINLLDPSIRSAAVSLISEARFKCNLDAAAVYVAVNYVDRFLSVQTIPRGKPWVVRLLAMACISLACKMRQQSRLSMAELQIEEGLIFDGETIGRMEMVVLGALGWRMRSVTPFAFLGFFGGIFSPPPPAAVKDRAAGVIVKAQTEMKMLKFKPSVVAAAALLAAAAEEMPGQLAGFRAAVHASGFVDTAKLCECCNAMGELMPANSCDPSPEAPSSCRTPVTVLAGHQSYCSESDLTAVSSAANRKGGAAAGAYHRCQ